MREIQQIFRLMVNREILQEILFLLISFLLSTYECKFKYVRKYYLLLVLLPPTLLGMSYHNKISLK